MNNKQEFRSLNSADLEVQELERRLELSASSAAAAAWLDQLQCITTNTQTKDPQVETVPVEK